MSVRSLNKVMLIGNLTRDPQLRFTPSGTAVCTFGVATNRSWVPSDNSERQEETEFHNIVAWSKLAEICGQLLHKGDKVYVDGRIRTRDWKTQEGEERRTTEIVIDNMMLLSNSGGHRGPVAQSDEAGMPDATAMTDESGAEPAPKKAKSTKKAEVAEYEEPAMASTDVSDDIPF